VAGVLSGEGRGRGGGEGKKKRERGEAGVDGSRDRFISGHGLLQTVFCGAAGGEGGGERRGEKEGRKKKQKEEKTTQIP